MPLVLTPKSEPAQLRRRLTRLRWRWRSRLVLQFAAATFAALVAVLLVLGWTDLILRLPAIIRAIALIGAMVGGYWLIRYRFIQEWSSLGSDLDVALHIEEQFPEFNDSLASTVQFFDSNTAGSTALRSATERRAMRSAADCEFESLLPMRGPASAVGVAVCLTVIGALLAMVAPEHCRVAVLRILDPFGDHQWPTATRLSIQAPARLASGEPFLLQGELHGVIPDRVDFRFALDGGVPTTLALAVTNADDVGTFGVRLEPNRVPRSFRYQVAANDAATPWTPVAVLRPPELAPLDGRPSPQVHLEFPRYSRQAPVDLPDGGGMIEAVAGTSVTIRAAVDRPVRAATLELSDDNPALLAAVVSLFGNSDSFTNFNHLATAAEMIRGASARLDNDGLQLELTAIPIVSGRYFLRFADAHGLSGRRALEIRVTPDPSPVVHLERPAASRESLSILPDANIELQARIDDPVFAIRSIWLEHRIAAENVVRRVPLMDVRDEPATQATVSHRLELKSIPLDRPLRDGDVLILAVAADDFDDVTPTKAPGRSHEVELHIVSPASLAAILQKIQAGIQKELAALHQLQKQARELAESADAMRHSTGDLRTEDRERLNQSSQLQQQIRQRIGDSGDGVRAAVEQLRQTLRNNPQPVSQPERERADAVAAELERLAQEALASIEPMLAAARSERDPVWEKRRAVGPLPDAIRHQRDAERTLSQLAERMGAWSEAREMRAEAGLVERELARLVQQRERFEQQPGVRGARTEELTSAQRAELAKLSEQQSALADRANELGQRLAQKAAEKQARSAKAAADESASAEARDSSEQLQREAEALAKARDRSLGPPSISAAMQSAAKSIAANRQGEAGAQQQAARQALENVQAALAEMADQDVDRLAKRLKDAEDAVEKLLDQQERLQKQSADARSIGNGAERGQALQRLAQKQNQLREQADELAQRLMRWNQDSAARDVRRAARAMEQAREQLENGDSPDDRQDDALDRLDDASKDLNNARERLDSELQRERQANSLERVKGFLQRQTGLSAESERLFQAAKAGAGWTRGLQKSLIDLAQSERSLSDELGRFVQEIVRESQVIAHWLTDSARSMSESADAIETARGGALDLDTWDDDRRGVQSRQAAAESRLKQLIEAVEEAEKAERKRQRSESPEAPSSATRGAKSSVFSSELQWKLLRMMQAELNGRTAAFAREHPDPQKWTPAERQVLEALLKSQTELANLLESLSAAETPASEQKDKKQ